MTPQTSERPDRGATRSDLSENIAATKPLSLIANCSGTRRQSAGTQRPRPATALTDHELSAWQATLDHLAAAGVPGIAPDDVVQALAARARHGRRHLALIR